ncbi:MAG: thioesterase family protein [Solirubrobacterales bacterium]|nr:thioesterase family protein [Solirubrobacterales bacterium]
MPASTIPAFLRDTAVAPRGEGRYDATCSPDWSAPTGPNGGYLAAIVLRAMLAEVDDPAREARSLTLHYLRAPRPGPLEVRVTVERTGRTMSTCTARLEQDGRPCVLAMGAFGGPFEAAADFRTPPPVVVPADELTPARDDPRFPPISRRLEVRRAIGGRVFSGAPEADSGGYLRLREPVPFDGPLLALLVDAWLPAVFAYLSYPALAPTIELTIHFRDPVGAAALPPETQVLARFVSRTAAHGYAEEDGWIWAPDGTLLAQSRQLHLLRAAEMAAS